MIDVRTFRVPRQAAGTRIDVFLSRQAPDLALSRSQVQRLIEEGRIKVNGKACSSHQSLKPGESISVVIPEPRKLKLDAENIPLDVLYEDDELLVVNKQAGLVTHPAPGNYEGTLVNALLHHLRGNLPQVHGAERPGIVHRLDKDTTGCLVVAKTDAAFESLTKQIQDRSAKRHYLALAWGGFEENEGKIEGAIGRSPRDRKLMAVVGAGGRPALTHFKVRERFQGATLLELELETGRTHQIRVHLSSIKHPLLGDEAYGHGFSPLAVFAKDLKPLLKRQMLHAAQLTFSHPQSGKAMHFEAPLPDDIRKVLELLRKHSHA